MAEIMNERTAASEHKTAELLTAYPEAASALTSWLSGFLAGATIRTKIENETSKKQ